MESKAESALVRTLSCTRQRRGLVQSCPNDDLRASGFTTPWLLPSEVMNFKPIASGLRTPRQAEQPFANVGREMNHGIGAILTSNAHTTPHFSGLTL